MATHMKTTVEISDALLARAKEAAARKKTTLRELIEAGLRHVLEDQQERRRGFWLRKASFRGKGLQAEAMGASRERIRDMAYEGRGG